MKGVTKWSFRPYRPLLFDTGDIYICRVYPYTGQIGFDWLPAGDGAEYTVCWRRRGSGSPFETLTTKETSVLLTGLEDGTDYEFKVTCGEKPAACALPAPASCRETPSSTICIPTTRHIPSPGTACARPR